MITKITDKILFEGDEDKVTKGRYRAFFVRTYAPLDALRDVFAYADKYAYILHDSDVNADGTPKAPHSHFIVRYRDNLTPSAFAKKMEQIAPNEQTYFSPLGDKYTAIDYMLHRDSKSLLAEKHRYPTSAILTEDIDYFLKSEKEQKEAKNKQFFDDLFEGKLTRKEMAYKYGRDYAKNVRGYEQFVKECSQNETPPKPADDEIGIQAMPREYFTKSFAEELLWDFYKRLKVLTNNKINLDELEVDSAVQYITKYYNL